MMMHMMEEEATHEGQEEEGEEKSPQAIAGDAAAPAAVVYKKGAWSKEEDEKLRRAVDKYGLRNWVAIEKFSGLGRPAKNCRLRWLNYLRPNLKKYPFTEEEEELIFELHSKYGNSWSRIASKLPGRSDNEIKNFWHKKAKKRHKHHHHHHLPIHPSTTTNQNNHTGDARDEYFPNTSDHHISPAALYPQHILSSTSAPSPRILPSTPNAVVVNTSSHQSYLRIPQSPNNHLSDQTTPTSRTQNLLISPHLRTDAMVQNDEFMILRNPPILSTPQCSLRRFSRNNSKLSANPHSVPNEAEAILSTPSPMQMQLSSAMVSPTSPLKLNLSPRVEMPPLPTMDSQASSLPPFQLQSPISPLKLRLSIPIPSESFLNSNSTVHSSPTSGLMPSKQSLPQSHSSQEITREPPSMQVEPDCSLEIMEELKEARARVKFLKNKLRLKTVSKNSNKRAYPKNMPKMNGSEESCETKTIRTESSENDYSSFTLGEIFRRGNSMSVDEQSHSTDCFHHLNPQNNSNPYDQNICSLRGLAGKFWEECSTMDSLYHQNSTLLENGDLQGDLFGQRPGIEVELSSHSQAPPVDPFNPAHSQSTTTIILIKPEDDNSSRSNYLCLDEEGQYFGYGLGQEITNGFVRKLGEDCLIDDNLGVKSVFQYPKSDLLDSRSLVSAPIMEQEYFRVEQFSHQIPAGRTELCEQKTVCGNRLIDNVVESGPAQEWPAQGVLERCREGCAMGETETWRQEHCREQSFMQGLLVDELWPEGLPASQDRTFSTSRDSELKKIWNDEAGGVLKQDHINTMSEELSSLLEFFPTTSQGQDWYYTIGNAIPNTNLSSGFDNPQMSPTSHPQLTIADYL